MDMNSILAAAFAAAEQANAETPVDTTPEPEQPVAAPDEISLSDADVTPHGWDVADTSVEDDSSPAPVARLVYAMPKGLDEKAVLIQVKRRMYSPYKLDEAESKAYGAGNVNKHLFQGRDNRVKQAISAYTSVYAYVKDNTVPWTTGVDMLNITHYMDVTRGLRDLIAKADATVADLVRHWDDEVRADYNRLLPTGHACLDDYPTASEVAEKFGIEVRFMPVPTAGDFRVQISDEDKASLQKQLEDAERNAARHVIEQMLEPMKRAVDKLAVPIGDDGSIFRDSLIDNMVEVAERMNRVNISDDPVVRDRINDLRSLIGAYSRNKDVLRNSQSVREKAATQINDLVSQMAGLV